VCRKILAQASDSQIQVDWNRINILFQTDSFLYTV